jgi:hypothetical protein
LAWPYLLRRLGKVDGLDAAGATDVTSVYGYPGPLAWGCGPGDPFVSEAFGEIVGAWRAQGAVAAFTRFHPVLGNASLVAGVPWERDPDAPEPIVDVGRTVSVDCSLDDEAARAGYARPLRQHVAAGRRAGLTTIHDEAWAHLPAFTRLYLDTMARNGAAEHYRYAESEFVRLRESLGTSLHLLVTRLGDEVAAAGLFTEFRGIVQAHLVGTNSELRALSPFKILLDDARIWARSRGDAVLHIGGGRGGREDSLFRFKSEFSPRRHVFRLGRWVLDPDGYRDLVTAHQTRAATRGERLDPGFFPAYRAPAVPDPAA